MSTDERAEGANGFPHGIPNPARSRFGRADCISKQNEPEHMTPAVLERKIEHFVLPLI